MPNFLHCMAIAKGFDIFDHFGTQHFLPLFNSFRVLFQYNSLLYHVHRNIFMVSLRQCISMSNCHAFQYRNMLAYGEFDKREHTLDRKFFKVSQNLLSNLNHRHL